MKTRSVITVILLTLLAGIFLFLCPVKAEAEGETEFSFNINEGDVWYVELGETKALPDIITNVDLSTVRFTWSWSKTGVADVNFTDFTVSGLAEGYTKLTANMIDNASGEQLASCQLPVSVVVSPTRLELPVHEITVVKGASVNVPAPIREPERITTDSLCIRLSSADTSVVTVSSTAEWTAWNGGPYDYPPKINGKAAGTTTVTLSIKRSDGTTLSDTLTVHVDDTKYYVSFDGNKKYYLGYGTTLSQPDGSTEAVTAPLGTTIQLPECGFSVPGYRFTGWNTAKDGSGTAYAAGDDFCINADETPAVTLYAQWALQEYPVHFVLNGGETEDETDTTYHIDVSTGPGYPIIDNYVNIYYPWTWKTNCGLYGWYLDESLTQFAGNSSYYQVTLDQLGEYTLYAKWYTAGLTVHYDGNGATSGEMEDQYISFATYDGYTPLTGLHSNKFQRDGYTFKGWNTQPDGSGTSYRNSDRLSDINNAALEERDFDMTLYAQWELKTYTISYRYAESGDNPTSYTILDTPITLLPAPEMSGYTFDGWYTDSDFTEPITEIAAGTAKTLTLYAKYTPHNYTIHFDANGGTGVINDITAAYNEDVELPVTGFEKYFIGNSWRYYFVCWNTKADGSGTSYCSNDYGETVSGLAPEDGAVVTLYAQWRRTFYLVHFDPNGGTGTMDDQPGLPESNTYKAPACEFTGNGLTFVNWNTKADGSGTSYYAGQSYGLYFANYGGDITLYAQWQGVFHDITYVNMDGEGVTNPNPARYAEGAVLNEGIALQDPTWPDHDFLGWYRDANFSTPAAEIPAGSTTDLTFYAKWVIGHYTIHFDANAGSDSVTGATQDLQVPLDTARTLPSCGFTRAKYNFVSWNTAADGSGTTLLPDASTAAFTAGKDETLTLYAIWERMDISGTWGSLSWSYSDHVLTISGEGAMAEGTADGTDLPWYELREDVTSLVIEHGVTSIAASAFIGEANLVNVTIPLTVTAVGENAFAGCGSIAAVDFSGSENEWSEVAVADGNEDLTGASFIFCPLYNVAFDGNGATGGSQDDMRNLKTDDSYAAPACTYEKYGHVFTGWNTEADGSGTSYLAGDSFSGLSEVPGDTVTLYALWSPVEYSISFVLRGGNLENVTVPVSYNYYSDPVTLPEPTRAGYNFAGWYTEITYLNEVTEIPTGSAGNMTFYAKWLAHKYTVKFEGNGATSGTMKDMICKYSVEYSLHANTFKRNYYTFTGWNTRADGKGSSYTDEQVFKNLKAADGAVVTFYAQWTPIKYTITYVLNGGTNSKANITKYKYTTEDFTFRAATKANYVFEGWYTDAEYKNKITVLKLGSYGDKTLYAKWSPKVYTITYKLNGGTNSADNPASYTVESAAITFKKPTRKYYTFSGWYKDADLTLKVTGIKAGSTGNRTFYAKWTVTKYTVTYELNGGTNSKANISKYTYFTDTFTLRAATRKGYTFVGWYKDAALTKKVTEITKGSSGNKTFYAKWTPVKYTITYKLNGGTNSASNPADYTIESAKIALAKPTRTGYTFAGWYTESAFTTKVTAIAAGSTGNKTFYAKWTANTYTIVFDGNGNDKNYPMDATVTCTYGKAVTLPKNEAYKSGYYFIGWSLKANGSGTVYADEASVKNLTAKNGAVVTLYAVWGIKTPEIFLSHTPSYIKIGVYHNYGATGYEIYRSVSKTGTYTKIATVSDNGGIVYYQDNNCTAGKTYYYKVREYVTDSSGKKTYSDYSEIQSAKLAETIKVTTHIWTYADNWADNCILYVKNTGTKDLYLGMSYDYDNMFPVSVFPNSTKNSSGACFVINGKNVKYVKIPADGKEYSIVLKLDGQDRYFEPGKSYAMVYFTYDDATGYFTSNEDSPGFYVYTEMKL